METNSQIEQALDLLKYTSVNIFLTGKAGTGKTTFLKSLTQKLQGKRMIVVAPTGVAALNAGGVTIHSFFQLSFGPYNPLQEQTNSYAEKGNFYNRLRKEKIEIIRSLELLIIDEISMVRSDVLDAMDDVLKRYRRSSRPFGGVQLLMIGDLQQLAPVVKEDEWEILSQFYSSPFFFDSSALKSSGYATIELMHIYRQKDKYFTDILNAIRTGNADMPTLDRLNERYIPNFTPKPEDDYIILTTHNASSQRTNENKLQELSGKERTFKAEITGNFPELIYPTDFNLRLKIKAQVMFIKNDSSGERRFYNGKIGIIKEIKDDCIIVSCKGEADDIKVIPEKWNNVKYTINPETKDIEESLEGIFKQFPLKTAWAITIHKSQGLTFERAIIDAGASFAHGQVYVALSRCRTLEGLVLSSPIKNHSLISSSEVCKFNEQISENQLTEDNMLAYKRNYYAQTLTELFDFIEVRKLIFTLLRIFRESTLIKLYPTIYEELNTTLDMLQKEVFPISERFCQQLSRMVAEAKNYQTDTQIIERITKGAEWFIPRLEVLIEAVRRSRALLVDNKETAKSLSQLTGVLLNVLGVKYATIKQSRTEFSIEKYQKTKAYTLLNQEDAKATKAKAAKERREGGEKTGGSSKLNSEQISEISHPELFETMVQWRRMRAAEIEKPPFIIMHQKVLLQIVNMLPTTAQELLSISGVGKHILNQYGAEIFDMVKDYCISNNIFTRK